MSDSRSISGTVTTEQDNPVASVAYRMAKDLWLETTGDHPGVKDVEFLVLVRICVGVLKGRMTLDEVRKYTSSLKV